MSVDSYSDLVVHKGHKIEVVTYAEQNVAIECEDCGEVLLDFDFNGLCLDCKKEKEYETDIQLCEECMKNYDTDLLWKLHDKRELDALDFNESPKMRERFRIKKKKGEDNG